MNWELLGFCDLRSDTVVLFAVKSAVSVVHVLVCVLTCL